MAEEKKKPAAGPKVSPARTIGSLVLLLIVGAICVVELRAGFGQMLSGKALAAISKEGEFTDLSLEEARGMLTLAPKESVEERGPDSMYRYEWYSILRPLMGQQNPQISIIASNDEKPMALAFTTADEEPRPEMTVESGDSPPASPTMGAGGMGMGPGSGMGMGGGGGGGRKRPDMEDTSESTDQPAAAPAEDVKAPDEPAEKPTESPAPVEPAAPGNP